MNEILYQVVAVDSDLIKGYPDKVTCISENENMANGVIYNDYDFKNHRYIKSYVSDNFNIFDKHKEQEEKIYNLQSKIDKAIEFINKHCVNEKISKEVGYKCYTMADTNELEKIMNILGDDK